MVQELTLDECDVVAGSQITWDTSFWYDLGNGVGHFLASDGYDVASD